MVITAGGKLKEVKQGQQHHARTASGREMKQFKGPGVQDQRTTMYPVKGQVSELVDNIFISANYCYSVDQK